MSIDKFTEIDDLLRQNQILQSDLLQQQQLTNRLLLTLLRSGGVGAGIGGAIPEIAGVDVTELAKAVGGVGTRYKTLAFKYPNQTITGAKVIYEARHAGAIQECLFLSASGVSGNDTYTIEVIADGNEIYYDTYTAWAVKSDYLTDLTAFDDGTYYVLTFNWVFFNESILIRVSNSSATFTTIDLKIVKRLEAGIR